ncbi:MAG: STAS domain-containing protein [Candidatus Baltobacteraceae bacterium]
MINPVEEFDRGLTDSANGAFIRERVGDIEFIHVYGDVDMANVGELERCFNGPHSLETRILANLSNCRYMDSAGLAVLVRAKKNFGEKFSVALESDSNLERLLKITSLYNILM